MVIFEMKNAYFRKNRYFGPKKDVFDQSIVKNVVFNRKRAFLSQKQPFLVIFRTLNDTIY